MNKVGVKCIYNLPILFRLNDIEVKQESMKAKITKEAVYKEGENAMLEFMLRNMKYPKEDRENNIQGKVVVAATIEKDGSVSKIEVVEHVSKTIDEESIRVVKLLTTFEPATNGLGEKVSSVKLIPLVFKMWNE